MRFVLALALLAGLAVGPDTASAQQQQQHAFANGRPEGADSVRQKVGYRHWEGAAIGAGAGAAVGLLLYLAVGNSCSDCDTESSMVSASLVTAGLGGAFGFLVGLATPTYRWVADTAVPTP